MPSIDDRVVAMAFENDKFEAGVAQTMSTLSKLDVAIKNIGSNNGLQNIEASASKVSLQGPMSALDKLKAKLGMTNAGTTFSDMEKSADNVTLNGPERALDTLKSKLAQTTAGDTFSQMENQADRVNFSGLQRSIEGISSRFNIVKGAAAVALGNIESRAVMAGTRVIKAFSLDPVLEGFHNYETQINAVQTILANTGLKGSAGLNQVNAALQNLQKYANLTVYNFSEMAKNIGTFTAAGVKLGPAVDSIKGIANLAALSGSNSQQASTAMYQLSQAIAAGQVHLQDWNSVVNAGMGGAVFQKALMRTGVAMGTISQGALKIDKATGKATINGEAFRQSISAKPGQQSWLTSDVLTKTLGQFTGDLSNAQLAAEGFNAAQIKAIQAQAKTAVNAATQIKTFSQLTQALKEEVGTAWANVFKVLFGDINVATKLFSNLHVFMENALTGPVNNFAKVLAEWSKLGGRKDLLDGLKSAFQDLEAVLKPIHDAFRTIFPPETAHSLLSLTQGFKAFADSLKLSPAAAENLQHTFQGLFAILHIGLTILGDVIKLVGHLVGATGGAAGGILSFTGSIGDFLTALDNAISKGHALDGFFQGLENVLRVPLTILGALANAFFSLFDGVDKSKAQGVEDSLSGIGDKLKPLSGVINGAVSAWHGLVGILGNVKDAVSPLLDNVASVLSDFGKNLAHGIQNTNFDLVFSAIQTTLIGGIFVAIKKALGGGLSVDIGHGMLGQLSNIFKALTGNLEAMQKNVQANTILQIASAIGILAAAVFVMSRIDPKRIGGALTAIAIGLGELMGSLKLMTTGLGKFGALQLPLISAAVIGLATAMVIFAGAMKIFATMSWEQISKGLVAVAGALAAVGAGTRLIGPSITIIAPGVLAVAVAMTVLAVAMKIFATLKWEEIAKGLTAMAGSLGVLAAGLYMIGPEVLLVGPGLIMVAGAITLLSGAIQSFSKLSWEELYKGIGGVAGALSAIAVAIQLIPPTVALQAAGLVILSVALGGIAASVKLLGGMDLESIIKGITALAGVFLVLAVGLTAMEATLPGSVALLAAAAAIAILAPALALLGSLSWGTILKGVAAIAIALGTIAVVGLVAAPALVAIGIALVPLGIGFGIVAGAAYLFAKALAVLGSDGQKGVAVMIAALTGFVAIIPTVVINFVKGMVGIAQAVAQVAPQVLLALGSMLDTIIAFVITEAPKLAIAIGVLVDAILQVLVTNSPKIISAGVKLLMDLLGGLNDNIQKVTNSAANVVAKFLQSLADNAPKLIAGGVAVLVAFIGGITSRMGSLVSTVTNMIIRFVGAIGSQFGKITSAGVSLMAKLLDAVQNGVVELISKGTQVVLNFLSGISNAIPKVIGKGVEIIGKILDGISSGMVKIANRGADAVINFLNGVADAIRTKGPQLRAAGWNVASALIDGIWQGVEGLGGKVMKALEWLAGQMPGWMRKILGIHSPSSVFMEIGQFSMMGLAQGIEGHSAEIQRTSEGVGNSLIGAFKDVLGIRSPSTVMQDIGQQVGAGFAKGLRGSQSDIQSAFSDLNDKLTQAMKDAKQAIVDNEQQLNQQRASSTPDATAIAAAEKAIATNQDILNRTYAAHQLLNGALRNSKNELEDLSKQYDKVTAKLTTAQQALTDAKQKRDDEVKSLEDQYSTLPNIMPDGQTDESVADYAKQLTDQVTAVQAYNSTLQQLRKLGLDDQTYQKLLTDGTADQQFADQLLAGGTTAIQGLNALDSQLTTASDALATHAAKNLYQAGVNAAQGLVNGLKDDKSEIESTMDDIARSMVNAIKKRLKIKSPSEVFSDIAGFMTDGLVSGLQNGTSKVVAASTKLGADTVSAIKGNMVDLSSAFSENIDASPVITPVLDLSQVQKDAKQLGDLTNVVPITAAASYGQASAISTEKTTADETAAAQAPVPLTQVSFEQNNYSPEALSEIEIYRQTNNQLAALKRVVGLNT